MRTPATPTSTAGTPKRRRRFRSTIARSLSSGRQLSVAPRGPVGRRLPLRSRGGDEWSRAQASSCWWARRSATSATSRRERRRSWEADVVAARTPAHGPPARARRVRAHRWSSSTTTPRNGRSPTSLVRLERGDRVVVVCDAGMPGMSTPGSGSSPPSPRPGIGWRSCPGRRPPSPAWSRAACPPGGSCSRASCPGRERGAVNAPRRGGRTADGRGVRGAAPVGADAARPGRGVRPRPAGGAGPGAHQAPRGAVRGTLADPSGGARTDSVASYVVVSTEPPRWSPRHPPRPRSSSACAG